MWHSQRHSLILFLLHFSKDLFLLPLLLYYSSMRACQGGTFLGKVLFIPPHYA